MTQSESAPRDDMAEPANVAEAGPPKHIETGGPQAEPAPPSPADLDRREARFTQPRKPMGPEQESIPETEPGGG